MEENLFDYQHSWKYLSLCSAKQRNLYRFRRIWWFGSHLLSLCEQNCFQNIFFSDDPQKQSYKFGTTW